MSESAGIAWIPIVAVLRGQANGAIITTAVFLGFSYLTVGLRFYTRIYLINGLGSDDYMVLASLAMFTAFCVILWLLFAAIVNITLLPNHLMTVVTNELVALESMYVVAIAFFKVSLGLFFLRILVAKWERRIIYAILVVFSVYSTGYFFFAIFQCGVPGGDRFWARKLFHRCAGESAGLTLGYLHAALTSGTDLIFIVLPIQTIRRSRLNLREKWVVGGILIIGTMGCIASFIRIKWVSVLVETNITFFHNGVNLAIWSGAEIGLGIIASSIATLRPLFRHVTYSIRDPSSSRVDSTKRTQSGSKFSTNEKTLNNTEKDSWPKDIDPLQTILSEDFVIQGFMIADEEQGTVKTTDANLLSRESMNLPKQGIRLSWPMKQETNRIPPSQSRGLTGWGKLSQKIPVPPSTPRPVSSRTNPGSGLPLAIFTGASKTAFCPTISSASSSSANSICSNSKWQSGYYSTESELPVRYVAARRP